ncbi:hypothetical protein, partial [Oscillatoria sp. HE19RPO]|uniref:hypothetical protein n=1 Tax=Oscillatoria sp. HE19RPO TaxID=2954806 RepID=UPI0020C28516
AKYKSSKRATESKVCVGAQCLRPYIDRATPLIYERTFWRFYFLEFPYELSHNRIEANLNQS